MAQFHELGVYFAGLFDLNKLIKIIDLNKLIKIIDLNHDLNQGQKITFFYFFEILCTKIMRTF